MMGPVSWWRKWQLRRRIDVMFAESSFGPMTPEDRRAARAMRKRRRRKLRKLRWMRTR